MTVTLDGVCYGSSRARPSRGWPVYCAGGSGRDCSLAECQLRMLA